MQKSWLAIANQLFRGKWAALLKKTPQVGETSGGDMICVAVGRMLICRRGAFGYTVSY
jgi:hypothetical protein